MLKNVFQQIWPNQMPVVMEQSDSDDSDVPANSPPIKRIHPVMLNTSTKSPPLISRSPALGRAVKGEIPFVVPPLASSWLSDTLQIPPYHDHERHRREERSSIESNSTYCPSDDGWSENGDKSLIGTPTLSRLSQGEFNQNRCVDSPTLNNKRTSAFRTRDSLLGTIQPELYKYTECKDCDLPPSLCGRVWFSMVYDITNEALAVKVIKVKQLQHKENNNYPLDTFVRLFLLPDERKSQHTKVCHRSNNPVFNETFIFQVSQSDLRKRTLRFSVYETEKRKSVRHLLGHALVSLKNIDLSRANEVMRRDLDDIAHAGDSENSLGELNVAMTYFSKLQRLVVVIEKVKNLRNMEFDTGVHVRVILTQGHKVIKTKKTSTKEGATDLSFNESFSFQITAKAMEQTCLSISVVSTGGLGKVYKMTSTLKSTVTRGRCGSCHKYGGVAIGSYMFCRGSQLMHWQDMMAQPGKSVARWHALSSVAMDE